MAGKNILLHIANSLDLPGEAPPTCSAVELLGENQILIDTHGGILHYSPDKIIVTVSYGRLEITGQDLEMLRMTAERIIINGRPEMIALIREEST